MPLNLTKASHLLEECFSPIISYGAVAQGSGNQLNQRLGAPEGIHGAGAETLRIERDVGKAQGLEDAIDLLQHLHVEGASQFVFSDLNAGNFAMVPDPHLAKAQAAQLIFALLDRR